MKEVFKVTLEGINEHITTDDLLRKLRLMSAGCGCRVLEAERVEGEDEDQH